MAVVIIHSGESAIVDDDDFAIISQLKWYRSGKYVVANIKNEIGVRKQISMHRLITNCRHGFYVDHIDGDGLNNQRKNLRVCTPLENAKNRCMSKANRSGYKGVSYCKTTKKWYASIKSNKKSINLGYHESPQSAYEAYKSAAYKLHGEFASY